ncbi:hypothetical protein HOLleu_00769 [Holothuria leucospilota]|uniref:Uncharacterized protein n=1 Tax=Holothuria leucospilota TaxID=206669 RepID=A0A9Q1CP23_HOLLE|nr:hypothetical protein HOLleu_00769 [Holothuria leucospilota]
MTNPLSPKARTHKLGVLYYTIKNVHPRHLSTLNHFYLAALYKSSDVAEFGFDVVLRPLVDDLKQLEESGLEITCQGKNGTVKLGLAQVVGDNLGIHSLFGFAQGFTANLLCRKCKSHRDDQCFHVVTNFAPDVMHNLLEGICAFEVKLVLHQLISNGSFDLETLNARIMSYNYGFPDSSNRPCIYKWSSLVNADGAPGQNAAQMWALIRNIGVMIADLVTEDDEHWELTLLLCDCMDIILSPAISAGERAYMREIISDHHELFLELFPNLHLKPKHHFMLHYPAAALKSGPLVHYWSMRFEAKHNFFCRLSHIICNFKNITKSMAYGHQMFQRYQMRSKQSFKETSCEIGPGSCLLLNSIPDCHVLSQLLGGILYLQTFLLQNGL